MSNEILREMTSTTDKLLQAIESFPEEKFNTVPFAGSWTAGQVSEHILKSVSGIPELLYGDTKPTTRNPEEKVDAIKTMFLDFTTKMKSPDFVLPGNDPIEKEKMLASWQELKTKMMGAINNLDLSATSTVFELPGFGEFTRSEWIWFAIYHTQRHTHQLKKIHELITQEKEILAS